MPCHDVNTAVPEFVSHKGAGGHYLLLLFRPAYEYTADIGHKKYKLTL